MAKPPYVAPKHPNPAFTEVLGMALAIIQDEETRYYLTERQHLVVAILLDRYDWIIEMGRDLFQAADVIGTRSEWAAVMPEVFLEVVKYRESLRDEPSVPEARERLLKSLQ